MVNADGEVAILTSGGGDLDFGGGPLAEERTHAVARLGPDGQHRWSLAVPRPDFTSATYIGGFAVDSTGAVIVAGQYSGALAFGGKAFVTGNIEERRPFVARLVAP